MCSGQTLDVLADFNGILERNLVSGAEYSVLSDFLVYVEDQFPGLGPYRTLGLCAGNAFRTARRLRSVLADALETESRIDRYGSCADKADLPGVGSRVYLSPFGPNPNAIQLWVAAADTLAQARIFYKRPNAVAGVRRLKEEGWTVGLNFHFGAMQAGYVWTGGSIDPDSYLDLWTNEIHHAGAIPRDKWSEYFDWLVEKKIATAADREEFDLRFTSTNRQTATPRPGLFVARRWLTPDAVQLDAAGKFVAEVAKAYERITVELGP